MLCVWVFAVMPLYWVNWHNEQLLEQMDKINYAKLKVLVLLCKANSITELEKLNAKYDSLNTAFDYTNKEWITLW